MPTSGPTSVPAPGPSGASLTSVPSVAKAEGPVKQIAICAIQSPGSSIAPAAPQTRAPVTAGQFIGQAGVTSLGTFMINRFAPEGRQTVLLQPRGATGQPVVVTTSNASTPIRFIPQHHTIRTIVPAPVSRNNSSVQLVNLSVSNPTANSVHAVSGVKSATGSRPFGSFPVESVGLVLQSSAEASVRPIRVQSTVAQAGKTLAARAPQPKVINLTTSGVNNTPARHNILLSPATAGSSAKPAILNLNKSGSAVIINPNSGVQLTGTTGSLHPQHLSNQGKSAVIPINSAVMTIGQLPRHHPVGSVSTGAAVPFSTSQRIITSNSHVQQHHVVSISAASSLKPCATPAHTSPVKQSVPVPTPASPRPSILSRKRVVPDVRPVNQLLTPTKVKAEIVGKVVDGEEENHAVADRLSQSTASQESAATPRKKPRKQLLEPYDLSSTNLKLVNCSEQDAIGSVTDAKAAEGEERQDEEMEDGDQSETDDASQEDMDCEDEDEDEDDEETFSTPSPPSSRKPRISLFPTHPPNWKALQHHFLRYTDVKPKPEKKLTLSELSNEGLQKKNGWKIHHLATQMEDMSENESELLHRLNLVLTSFEDKVAERPVMRQAVYPDSPFLVTLGDKLADLIRGNIQRSSLFQEQMTESKQLLIKLTNDHRERVAKLTKKNINKRTCISK